jgi:Zn-dependent protease
MSWRDRDDAANDDPTRRFGRPGGDWQGMRPSLDNPMTWSVTLGRFARITVRVHVVFLLFIVIELLRSATGDADRSDPFSHGLGMVAIAMGCLFVIVLLHEFGHCLACRKVGGSADEILMWPLGGLAYCRPPDHWKAHLITVIGGPMVNVVLCVVAGSMLGLITGQWWEVAVPNPFKLTSAVIHADGVSPLLLTTLFWINALSFVLLLFNLLPIFPLDGGRIVQALMWPRMGYARSMRFAVRIGFLGAIALGVLGLVMNIITLVLIAAFGGITCYITSKQLKFTEEFMGYESGDYSASLYEKDSDDVKPAKPTEAERDEMEQVDHVLQKIAQSGMDSLTAAEKRLLRRTTRRKKQGD